MSTNDLGAVRVRPGGNGSMNWRVYLERYGRWLAVLLLLIFFARLLNTESQKSITFDEPPHVLNAVQYFQPRPMVSTVNNPPLLHGLMGIVIQAARLDYDMGYENDVWRWGDGFDIAHNFFWQTNENGFALIWAGRLAVMFLALLSGTVIYRWAGQLYATQLPALFALLLFTFDPSILGFGYLATTDLGIAFFLTLAGYTLWRYWRGPSWRRLLWAGFGVSLALGAKFSGVVIIPAMIVLLAYRWFKEGRSRQKLFQFIGSSLVILLLAAVLFLAIYRFEIPLLLADFQFQQAHVGVGHPAYLLGMISQRGWWYYFPVVFLAKVPVGLLALIGLGWGYFLWPLRIRWDYLWLLILAVAVFLATMAAGLDIGFRYLLPLFPPLYIFLGQLVQPGFQARLGRMATAVALATFLIVSVISHPHYTSFFNMAVGGSANGWRIAVDSNLDWGQDLEALGCYLEEKEEDKAFISWLGTVPLAEYGIQGRPFLTWPKTQPDLVYDEWLAERPLPGTYAISATQLAGPYLSYAPGGIDWFRQRTADDRVGASFFIYDVQPRGTPTGLALSGVGVALLAAEDLAAITDGNDIDLRWFDARTSFLWPGGSEEAVWAAVGAGHLPQSKLLQDLYPDESAARNGERLVEDVWWRYKLYAWPASPIQQKLQKAAADEIMMTDFGWSAEPVVGAADWAEKRRPLTTAVFAGTLELSGIQMGELSPGQPLELLSFWRVIQPPTNDLKIFIHILDEAGQVIRQHDGLDIRLDNLRPGDEFAQLHTIVLPEDLPSGVYALQIGLYEVDTTNRLLLEFFGGEADRVLLQTFSVGN